MGDPDAPDEKDRADHRHHAIDAFVVAVSEQRTVQLAATAAARAESYYSRDLLPDMPPPWDGFSWRDLERLLARVVVSSRVDRKLNGRLHKETLYGKGRPTPDAKSPGGRPTVLHVRKALDRMSPKDVERIADGAVRRAVQERLAALGGGRPDRVFADPACHPELVAKDGRRTPIHSARVQVTDSVVEVGRGSQRRRAASGDNHHMEVVATLDANGAPVCWEGVPVPRLEAVGRLREARRAGRAPAVVRHDHGPGKAFVFSLATGEHLEIDHEGGRLVYRVTTISGNRVKLVRHHDARPSRIEGKRCADRAYTPTVRKLLQLNARKVAIDPLGGVHTARD